MCWRGGGAGAEHSQAQTGAWPWQGWCWGGWGWPQAAQRTEQERGRVALRRQCPAAWLGAGLGAGGRGCRASSSHEVGFVGRPKKPLSYRCQGRHGACRPRSRHGQSAEVPEMRRSLRRSVLPGAAGRLFTRPRASQSVMAWLLFALALSNPHHTITELQRRDPAHGCAQRVGGGRRRRRGRRRGLSLLASAPSQSLALEFDCVIQIEPLRCL